VRLLVPAAQQLEFCRHRGAQREQGAKGRRGTPRRAPRPS
jgi:hypothetical protein